MQQRDQMSNLKGLYNVARPEESNTPVSDIPPQ